MGLDLSHGDFTMPYSAFGRMRQRVAKAVGCSYPPHDDPALDYRFIYIAENTPEGIRCLLEHSDCDGWIEPDMCQQIANELDEILPQIRHIDDYACSVSGGDWRAAPRVEKFIAACREAADRDERLEFF